ncbi:Ger(x)C family spore germination protein [Paenibacillus sp. p3-SID867]|uniref:Ger(x)C family spore germination protein n=1 Tax=Paenibacillus sp. p3-SID867 TaxID=2916363 RepID=UPI0021A87530|nr:Ger(x)C family spore germination protein [Paenibacillus sp. p3-SID867]MCT1399253.1 Ger(x)C family spore germination protein [Paenibacillus sp. p3-SID867]
MKHITIRILLSALLVFILLPLTGCWSNKEIEDLALIVGTSMDLEKQGGPREESAGQAGGQPHRNRITITNQFVTSETTGKGTKTGSSPQKAYNNVSETGDAILPTLRNMVLRIDKRAFAEHSKVIIIGEDLARTLDMQKILDFYIREQEMRPSGLLLIARNRASQTLESNKPMDIPAFQLVEMTHGHGRTTKILPPTTITKIEGKLHSGASFLLQNVVSTKGEIKFTGAAVIEGKTKKLRGFLNEKDLEGLTWISGNGKGGLVKSVDRETGQPIIYEVISMKSKIIPHVNGNNISFDIKIESEGRIAEHWVVSEKSIDTDFLKRVENAVEEEVERLVGNVLDKIQHEYKTDVAGFGNQLRIRYPRIWKTTKKDWDQIFSEVPMKSEVKVTIKDYGTSVE